MDSNETTNEQTTTNIKIKLDIRERDLIPLFKNNENIIFEDKYLVEKWSTIAEEHINKDLTNKTKSVIENALNDCHNKNLLRDYKMKKIFKDEPLQPRRNRKNK